MKIQQLSIVAFVMVLLIVVCSAGIYIVTNQSEQVGIVYAADGESRKEFTEEYVKVAAAKRDRYLVYEQYAIIGQFATLADAKIFAQHKTDVQIVNEATNQEIWNNQKTYAVYQHDRLLRSFDAYAEAVKEADKWAFSSVRMVDWRIIWAAEQPQSAKVIGVPLIYQMPELQRGCEVTSLAMILQYQGIDVSKMTLAKEIKKDPTAFSYKGNKVYFGNPYDGFVGDIYSFDKSGLGVYHGPIAELAEQYADTVVDMTGSDFNHILYPVSQGTPVWVIINSLYDELPKSQWNTWDTPSGEIEITYREHSVVIVGFDQQYVYVNDPLGAASKLDRGGFERAWNQMGKQAIAVY